MIWLRRQTVHFNGSWELVRHLNQFGAHIADVSKEPGGWNTKKILGCHNE